MERFKNTLLRIVAVFAADGLKVIGAGAVVGIPVLKAVIVAGVIGVATVVERLARGFLDDGKLSEDEIDAAFSQVDSRSKTVEDVQVENRKKETMKSESEYN